MTAYLEQMGHQYLVGFREIGPDYIPFLDPNSIKLLVIIFLLAISIIDENFMSIHCPGKK